MIGTQLTRFSPLLPHELPIYLVGFRLVPGGNVAEPLEIRELSDQVRPGGDGVRCTRDDRITAAGMATASLDRTNPSDPADR
jgi:hypothetical protein